MTCDQVKTDGYDGKEAVEGDVVQEPSQWSLSGALLYSVTIITTIGMFSKHCLLFNNCLLKTALFQATEISLPRPQLVKL